jgi:hypothetical protein
VVNAAVSPAACTAAMLIDTTFLDRGGATTLWFKGRNVKMRHVRIEQGNRPWVIKTPLKEVSGVRDPE